MVCVGKEGKRERRRKDNGGRWKVRRIREGR